MLALLLLAFQVAPAAPAAPASFTAPTAASDSALSAQPNILWLSFEDHGPQLGCYGDDYADTPTLDALASEGVRYQHCWANAPVCSTARTTLITGRYATSLAAHHHRSRLALPQGVRFFPQLLREAGYFCTNNRKEDYNLAKPAGTWDMSGGRAHWRARQAGQPFFAVFNVTISHESQIRRQGHKLVHDPAEFDLPPYYPDLPAIRRDWAQEYDKGTEMDARLGAILRELDEDGLREDTIIFAFGDHGSGMPRHKRWPGESGQSVPLIVIIPDKWKALRPEGYAADAVLERLVSFVDFGPTVLSLAGLKPDTDMQGIAFLGDAAGKAKDYLFGYRGRMDERDDCVRAITDGRYVYLWTPDWARPHGAHVSYQFVTPSTQAWYDYALAQPDAPAAIRDYWFGQRGTEDLFDLQSDPHETRDLSRNPEYAEIRLRLASALHAQITSSGDQGFIPEHFVHSWGTKELHEVAHTAYQFARSAAASDPANGSEPSRILNAAASEKELALREWWSAHASRSRARAGLEIDPQAWVKCEEAGTRVLLATAALLVEEQPAALAELIEQASAQQSNYFVRLLAWQALGEVVQAGRLEAEGMHAFRQELAEVSIEIEGLDRAYRDYLPRLRERVMGEN